MNSHQSKELMQIQLRSVESKLIQNNPKNCIKSKSINKEFTKIMYHEFKRILKVQKIQLNLH